MLCATLLLVASVQLCLTAMIPCGAGTGRQRRWLLRLVGLGLGYDAAVFGLGALVGAGPVLHDASIGRYLGHVLLTPLLVVWAVLRFTVPSTRKIVGAWVIAVALMILGTLTDLVGLRLTPRAFADTLRYVPADPAGPPIPALIVSLGLLAGGVLVARRAHDYRLAAGAAAVIVASAIAALLPPAGNVGEALLLAALVRTERPPHERRSTGRSSPIIAPSQ